jgi:RNase P subunit RPR2
MKEIELSFTVRILPSQTDVHWIEEELLRLREEVFLGVLEKVMLEIEREVLKRERRCKRCGVLLVRNGREAKRIKTLVGEVKVNRVRLRCQGCGDENYPLDQAMGLGCGERMTLGGRERLLWAAVGVSYEKTHQFLEKFTGLEVSHNRIHEVAVEEGLRIE